MAQMRDSQGRFVRVNDAYANLASGAGTTADKRTAAFYTRPFILPEQIEAAYRSSWFVRKGIDLPPFDMTRGGRDWQADEDSVDLIEVEEKRLQLWTKVRQALTLGRLGGGLIIMGVGNEDPATPLGTTARGKGSLRYLHVMNRWQVSLGPMVQDPTDDLFGQPAYFQLTFGKAGTGQVRIHPSRVIPFRGKLCPNLRGAAGDEWFWGDSLMATVGDAVKNADAAMNGFASLIEEAKLDTVSIPGLTQLVATTEGEALVKMRVSIANLMKSTHNTRILDGGKAGVAGSAETWETRQVTWAGMPDMIRTYAAAVAGAFDIPATRFLGKSPDGMNATGSGDEANYIAKIRADQNAELRPALDRIDAVLLPSAGVTLSSETWYDFPPLQEMSELDEATSFMNRMTAITALQNTGAIPSVAFEKALQNEAVERQWMAGLDGALAEMPEGERFPSEMADPAADTDPSSMQAEGGDPADLAGEMGGGGSQPPVRRAANDALRAAGLSDSAIDDVMAMIDASA